MDQAKTASKLRHIVSELERVERRLRQSDVDNLTYRHVFHALASTRQLLRELDPEGGGQTQ